VVNLSVHSFKPRLLIDSTRVQGRTVARHGRRLRTLSPPSRLKTLGWVSMANVFFVGWDRFPLVALERGCTRLILGTVRFKDLEVKYQPSAFSRQLTKKIVLH
jgi:hypothetical protein